MMQWCHVSIISNCYVNATVYVLDKQMKENFKNIKVLGNEYKLNLFL